MIPTIFATLRTGEVGDFPGIRFADPLMRADPDRARLIESSLRNGACIVAVDEGEILGFAILNYTFFGQGFVPLLVVAVANRRSGIGTRLLSEVERRCTKPKLYVSANRSNLPAQWLFEKCGFTDSGRIENLDVNDDELVFFKVRRDAELKILCLTLCVTLLDEDGIYDPAHFNDRLLLGLTVRAP